MNAHRPRGIDRLTAEQLLRGGRDGVRSHESEALSDLLSAAAAPATEGELAGEQAAVAAFRAARPVPGPRRARRAKVLTMKVAAVAAGVVAASGVAVAAATGHLPSRPGGGNPAPVTSAPASPASEQTTTAAGDRSTRPGPANGTPSPSFTGLCQAYSSGNKADHGRATADPAFGALLTTAGGQDKVDGYCAGLLAGKAAHEPGNDHPVPPGRTGQPARTHPATDPPGHDKGPPKSPPGH